MDKPDINRDTLKRIANHLTLNGGFTDNLGLYHGKMGIAIFFCHYARYINDISYNDFAGILIEQIYEEIHDKMYFDMEDGLCGIGWGIEYLIQNKFMEGNSQDILYEIDVKIMERDPLHLSDKSIRTGSGGILLYSTYRFQNLSGQQTGKNEFFDTLYNKALKKTARQIVKEQTPQDSIPIASLYTKSVNNKKIDPALFLLQLAGEPETDSEDITRWPLGIEKGCAGVGLKLMTI